jgi:hypothetical protein
VFELPARARVPLKFQTGRLYGGIRALSKGLHKDPIGITLGSRYSSFRVFLSMIDERKMCFHPTTSNYGNFVKAERPWALPKSGP